MANKLMGNVNVEVLVTCHCMTSVLGDHSLCVPQRSIPQWPIIGVTYMYIPECMRTRNTDLLLGLTCGLAVMCTHHACTCIYMYMYICTTSIHKA